MVLAMGLEPTRLTRHQILSLLRLPFRHASKYKDPIRRQGLIHITALRQYLAKQRYGSRTYSDTDQYAFRLCLRRHKAYNRLGKYNFSYTYRAQL